MRILVTGAGGFLGRAMLPALQSMAEVDRRNEDRLQIVTWSRATHGDVLNRDDRQRALSMEHPDTVIHLAWLNTSTADYEHDPLNHHWAAATCEFAEQAVAEGAWFIGLGSMIEADIEIRTPYAEAKRDAADALRELGGDARRITWLRPSWVFDFGEARPRVLRAHSESLSARGLFTPEDPDRRLDFVHVRDVANAAVTVAGRGLLGRRDIASCRETSVRDFLQAYDDWRSDAPQPDPDTDPANHSRVPDRGAEDLLGGGWHPTETERLLKRYWRSVDDDVA